MTGSGASSQGKSRSVDLRKRRSFGLRNGRPFRFQRDVLSRLTLLRLVLLLTAAALLLAACQPAATNRFPTLTTIGASPTPAVSKPTDAPSKNNPITLRVAGPFSAEAAEALRQLYLNFESGQLVRSNGTPIGDRFKPGGAIPDDASLTIRFEPVTLDQMMDGAMYRTMAEAGTLPDIFVTGDVGSLLKLNAIADLTPVLTSMDTLAASRIPIFALEALKSEGRYWGIPYLATVPMLQANQGLTDRLGLKLPETRMSPAELTELMITANSLLQMQTRPQPAVSPMPSNEPTPTPSPFQSVSTITDLRPFLKYWPASSDSSLGFAAWQNGAFRFEASAVGTTFQLLRSLDRNQMTPALSLAKLGIPDQAADRSLFRAGRSLFLIEDSSRLAEWSLQSHVQTRVSPLPLGTVGEALKIASEPTSSTTTNPSGSKTAPTSGAAKPTPTQSAAKPTPIQGAAKSGASAGRQPFTISACCVSSRTAYPSTAARIALFLAQDPDALLLQSQYGLYEGYVPLSNVPTVWDRLVGRQTSDTVLSGSPLLSPLRDRLRTGYANPSILFPNFDKALSATLLSAERFTSADATSATTLANLGKTAASLLKEDSR